MSVTYPLLLQVIARGSVVETLVVTMLQVLLNSLQLQAKHQLLNTPLPPDLITSTRSSNINVTFGKGKYQYLVHLLATRNLPLALSTILYHGACASQLDSEEYTALHLSVIWGHSLCTKVLAGDIGFGRIRRAIWRLSAEVRMFLLRRRRILREKNNIDTTILSKNDMDIIDNKRTSSGGSIIPSYSLESMVQQVLADHRQGEVHNL